MQLEQAIFTSAITSKQNGYQLVASSPGVDRIDAQALVTWGPSHDSLLERDLRTGSLNFHALPSGAYCLSQTTPQAGEHSCRGGALVYTQSFIVPPKVLARFSNNPFALNKALIAQGAWDVLVEPCDVLQPVHLVGGAQAVDQAVLSTCRRATDLAWLTSMMDEVLTQQSLLLLAEDGAMRFLPVLVNCLPLRLRTEVTFSTGLRYSPRRPYRLVVLEKLDDQQHAVRESGRTVCDLNQPAHAHTSQACTSQASMSQAPVSQAWTRLVETCLGRGLFDELKRIITGADDLTSIDALNVLAEAELSELTKVHHEQPEKHGRSFTVVRRNTVDDLRERLRATPDDAELWQTLRQLHTDLLGSHDFTTSAELVIAACGVLCHSGEIDEANLDKVGELLAEQRAFHRDALEETLLQLEHLELSAGRRLWLRLARAVRVKEWQPTRRIHAQQSHRPASVLFGSDALDELAGGEFDESEFDDLELLDGSQAESWQAVADGGIGRDGDVLDGVDEGLGDSDGEEPEAGKTASKSDEDLWAALERDPLLQLADLPSHDLALDCPQAMRQLEELDDIVFEAIAGKQQAFERLQVLWPEILNRLGPELVEESKAQYLRHAMSIWNQCADEENSASPEQGMRALDVVCLLLDR